MEYQIGDKVKFVNAKKHAETPRVYPAPGTIGEIRDVEWDTIQVQWSSGSTSAMDIWYCEEDDICPCRPKLKVKVYRRDRAGRRIRVKEVKT